MRSSKFLISLVGPTAVGKTAAAIALAQHYHTEIISADSRQFYREMCIGTAKPTTEEQAAAKHHFVDSHSINESFNVGDFEKEGIATLNNIYKHHNKAIMAGGSGLYVKAINEGFDQLPDVDPAVRESLNTRLATQGIEVLQQQLREVDPRYYTEVDLNNPQRIIRALEIFESTGQPFSFYRQGQFKERPFNIIKIGLDLPRAELYERINQRVDHMIGAGLIEEVKALLPYKALNALNTVGYTEVFNYLEGKTDLDTAISLIKQNTRRFAKRQLTWFKKEKDTCWFLPTDVSGIINYINEVIAPAGV